MPKFNTSTVKLEFLDVHKKPIKDHVRVTFDNFHLKSLNKRASFDRFPQTVRLEAFPTGLWQVFFQPTKYRPKSFILTVPAGKALSSQQIFFLHSDRARPIFPATEMVFSNAKKWKLADLIENSEFEGLKGADLYTELISNHPLLAAGLQTSMRGPAR